MAVVFISPKQRQKVFFLGITAMFLLILVAISLTVFLAGPKDISPTMVFNKPKVSIDMNIFDTDQFINLQLFPQMQVQYSYTAVGKDNKKKTGFISSTSAAQAKTDLEKVGMMGVQLKEVEVGRDNPFSPYYQIVVTPAKK